MSIAFKLLCKPVANPIPKPGREDVSLKGKTTIRYGASANAADSKEREVKNTREIRKIRVMTR